MGVVDYESHLGHVATRDPVVLGDGDQLVAPLHHEHAHVCVRAHEARHLFVRQPRVGAQITQADRFLGQAGVQGRQ